MEHWILGGMAALGLAIIALCLVIFGRLLASVWAGHGKVKAEVFFFGDLMLATVLISWLGGLAVHGFLHAESIQPMTDRAILLSAVLFGLVVGLIALFLRIRQISVTQLFGLGVGNRLGTLKTGAKLFFAVMPLILFFSALVQLFFGKDAEPQEIIKYFAEAARHSEHWRLILVAVVSVLIAPMMEEFIFRGYFYGVLRRYFGEIPALLFISALFALIHVNVTALLPLFVLAVGLTLAYETTGSLLAPMLMHALFNAVMLGTIFYISQHS